MVLDTPGVKDYDVNGSNLPFGGIGEMISVATPGVTNLRPAGRMRPAMPLRAAREALPRLTLRAARQGV